MAATLLPPTVTPVPEEIVRPSDSGNNGNGGGNLEEPEYGPNENPEADPERYATPLSAYRTALVFVMGSVMSVFGALTHILASRWINSKDWVAIGLPRILYFNTALLLLSSLTFEMGRRSVLRGTLERGLRWLIVTLLLGLAFVSGQIMAWREVVARGLFPATNPGSFFFYAFTAVHGLHLLGGVAALTFVIFSANRLARRGREKTAVGVVSFYWHFMDVLWVYLLGLLIFTV